MLICHSFPPYSVQRPDNCYDMATTNSESHDLPWNRLSPDDFEHFCFDLLLALGFHNVDWRRGGSDRGRDLEASWLQPEPGGTSIEQRWLVECKRYLSGGVPVSELVDKLAWADAENPHYLLIITSSHLLPSTKDWLNGVATSKSYRIRVWEGGRIAALMREFPDLAKTYFTSGCGSISGPRAQRLETDKLKVGKIAERSDGRIIIERTVGDPPYVYLLRLNVKTLEGVRDGSPLWRTHAIVRFSLPEHYPAQQPSIEVLTPLFHPNVSHYLCTGWSNSLLGLDGLIVDVYEIIGLQRFDLNMPMNRMAGKWFAEHPDLVDQVATSNGPIFGERTTKLIAKPTSSRIRVGKKPIS